MPTRLCADSPAIDREILASEINEGALISDRDTPADYNDVVDLLIVAGADVDAANKFGQTPLHRAVIGGHTLIFGGADAYNCNS